MLSHHYLQSQSICADLFTGHCSVGNIAPAALRANRNQRHGKQRHFESTPAGQGNAVLFSALMGFWKTVYSHSSFWDLYLERTTHQPINSCVGLKSISASQTNSIYNKYVSIVLDVAISHT